MFAIYPDTEKDSAKDHAVIFTECSELARWICNELEVDRGISHSAYLVLPAWPDPALISDLNGCGPEVFFSTRCGQSATRAAHWLRPRLQRAGFVDIAGGSMRE